MSVTFCAEPGPVTGFAFTCGHDNGMTGHRFADYAAAEAFLQAELDQHGNTGHLAVCGDDYCAESRMYIIGLEADPSPEVNVTNINARHLLGLLGYVNTGLCDSATAEDFLGRVLIAQAVSPADEGTPTTEEVLTAEGPVLINADGMPARAVVATRPRGTTIVQCGRPAGYSEERLAELREIADFAVSRGRAVQWG